MLSRMNRAEELEMLDEYYAPVKKGKAETGAFVCGLILVVRAG